VHVRACRGEGEEDGTEEQDTEEAEEQERKDQVSMPCLLQALHACVCVCVAVCDCVCAFLCARVSCATHSMGALFEADSPLASWCHLCAVCLLS